MAYRSTSSVRRELRQLGETPQAVGSYSDNGRHSINKPDQYPSPTSEFEVGQ